MSTLYVVATPIGNLEDLSLRAKRILQEVDFIICEDTRVTSKLLAHFAISKPLMSYFQHSHMQKMEEIVSRLTSGQNAALVTDAGTPGISDPGGVLIKYAITQMPDLQIIPIPGACAVVAALSISGFPTDKFLFLGFPPHKKGRQTYWKKVADSEHTVVFYESCHRIIKSLNELRDLLDNAPKPPLKIRGGDGGGVMNQKTQVVVCRELTKMFESVYRGDLDEVIKKVSADPIKGEYVVVMSNE